MTKLPDDFQELLEVLAPPTPKLFRLTIKAQEETVVLVESGSSGINRITLSSSSEVRVVQRPRGKK